MSTTLELRFESDGALEAAFVNYEHRTGDFWDCVPVALAARAGEFRLWTFDNAASKICGLIANLTEDQLERRRASMHVTDDIDTESRIRYVSPQPRLTLDGP